MAKAVNKHIGGAIDYKNETETSIHYGEVIALTDCIGIAAAEIPPGKLGTLYLTEVWEMPAKGEIGMGQKVYWDTADSLIVAKSGAKTIPAGVAVTVKADAAEGTVWVRISP